MEKISSKKSDSGVDLHPKTDITPGYGVEETRNKRKIPIIAALLSLVVPGLGQIYAGDLYRGFALFAALVVSLCLIVLVIGFFAFFATWIYSVSDAYKLVKKQNGEI